MGALGRKHLAHSWELRKDIPRNEQGRVSKLEWRGMKWGGDGVDGVYVKIDEYFVQTHKD